MKCRSAHVLRILGEFASLKVVVMRGKGNWRKSKQTFDWFAIIRKSTLFQSICCVAPFSLSQQDLQKPSGLKRNACWGVGMRFVDSLREQLMTTAPQLHLRVLGLGTGQPAGERRRRDECYFIWNNCSVYIVITGNTSSSATLPSSSLRGPWVQPTWTAIDRVRQTFNSFSPSLQFLTRRRPLRIPENALLL